MITKDSSVATPKAPPNLQVYGTSELALFKEYSRGSYQVFFGEEAPPYQSGRAAKAWFDSTAIDMDPQEPIIYKRIIQDSVGKPIIKNRVMLAGEAATVNLPPIAAAYMPYIIIPTSATRNGPGDLSPQPMDPKLLTTKDQARNLMSLVGGVDVQEASPMAGGFSISYPPMEPRREYEIVWRGKRINAGLLALNMYSKGIGHPGHFDLTGDEPIWVNDPDPVINPSATYVWASMPVRDLTPVEVLRQILTGLVVVRTDLEGQAQIEPGAAAFTTHDRFMLSALYDKLVKGQ